MSGASMRSRDGMFSPAAAMVAYHAIQDSARVTAKDAVAWALENQVMLPKTGRLAAINQARAMQGLPPFVIIKDMPNPTDMTDMGVLSAPGPVTVPYPVGLRWLTGGILVMKLSNGVELRTGVMPPIDGTHRKPGEVTPAPDMMKAMAGLKTDPEMLARLKAAVTTRNESAPAVVESAQNESGAANRDEPPTPRKRGPKPGWKKARAEAAALDPISLRAKTDVADAPLPAPVFVPAPPPRLVGDKPVKGWAKKKKA